MLAEPDVKKSQKQILQDMKAVKQAKKAPLPKDNTSASIEQIEARREKFYKTEDDLNSNKAEWSDVARMCNALQKIIPEGVLNVLKSIADFDNQSSWVIGDKANEIYARAKGAGLKYTHTDIYYFVSRILLNESRSLNTVKGYALVASRFSSLLREELDFENIPFSHFAFAGRSEWDEVNPDTGEYMWLEILRLSRKNYIAYGKPISVRKLREEYLGINPESSKSTYKTGKASSEDFSARMINPTNPEDFRTIDPSNAKTFVKARLQVVFQELSGLNNNIVGNIPNFPTSFFSQAIILLGEVIKKM